MAWWSDQLAQSDDLSHFFQGAPCACVPPCRKRPMEDACTFFGLTKSTTPSCPCGPRCFGVGFATSLPFYYLSLVLFGIAGVSITIASALMWSWPAGLERLHDFSLGVGAVPIAASAPFVAIWQTIPTLGEPIADHACFAGRFQLHNPAVGWNLELEHVSGP